MNKTQKGMTDISENESNGEPEMPCSPLRNLLITLTVKLFQQECSSKCLSPDLYTICSYFTFSCFLSLSFVL